MARVESSCDQKSATESSRIPGKLRNPEKPYDKLTVGIAPNLQGVQFLEDGKRASWQAFLDEVAEAGYEVIGTGPFGFLPTDPEVLQAECVKHGIRVVAGTQFGILRRPEAWEQTEHEMCADVFVLKAIGAHHLVYLPPMPRDLQTGGQIEDSNLSDVDWKPLAGNVNHLGKPLKEDYDVTMVVHPHGDSHIENCEQIDRFFAETGPEYVSSRLDIGYLEYGGMDIVDLICPYPNRTGLAHIKQMDPEVVQRVRWENLLFGEVASLGVYVAPDAGQPRVGAAIDAFAALDKEFCVTVEQDLYPCAPDVPLPLAIETRRVLADNHLGTH